MKSIGTKQGLINACILVVAFVSASGVCLGQQCQQDNGTWKSLFDGKSLDGWKKIGSDDSKWEVVDGVIQGRGRRNAAPSRS